MFYLRHYYYYYCFAEYPLDPHGIMQNKMGPSASMDWSAKHVGMGSGAYSSS